MSDQPSQGKEKQDRERDAVLHQLEDWLEGPVVFLGFVWLALLLVELVWGLNPFLAALGTLIWAIFILDFAVRFWLAPEKRRFLRRNWLTALSLFVPALRVLRVTRLARLVLLARTSRGLRLVKVVGSINRGMSALKANLGRRGFGYVAALTLMVSLLGAAGLFAFERDSASGFASYGESLWRTAMVITSMGTAAEPKSLEGRALFFLLALYSFTFFGYITAALASYFVGREAASGASDVAGERSIQSLRAEIEALRADLKRRDG
jgi:voltage-gated potassium channel